jgi:hypothetical protein
MTAVGYVAIGLLVGAILSRVAGPAPNSVIVLAATAVGLGVVFALTR